MGLSAAEQAELQSLQTESQGLSPSEASELASLQAEAGGQEAHPVQDALMSGLKYGVRGLDYAGGAVRSGLGTIGEAITGKKLVSPQEVESGLKGQGSFPSSDELMARAGVPKGPHLSALVPGAYNDPAKPEDSHWYKPDQGGMLDPTARGAAGFVGDMATDPLNWLTFGGAGLAKEAGKGTVEAASKTIPQKIMALLKNTGQAGVDAVTKPAEALTSATLGQLPAGVQSAAQKLLQAPTQALGAVGNKLYSSALAPIIEGAEGQGKREVADTLFRNGIYGTRKGVRSGMLDRTEELMGVRDQLAKAAADTGATVSRQGAFDPMLKEIQQKVLDRRMTDKEASSFLDNIINRYDHGPDPSPTLASSWKTDLRANLPKNAWGGIAATPAEDSLTKTAASGLQKGAENAIADSGQDAAKYALANADAGTLLSSRTAARQMAKGGGGLRSLLNPWQIGSTGLVAGLATQNPSYALKALMIKGAIDAARSTGVKSTAGYGLKSLGQSELVAPAIDSYLRRKLIDSQREDTP